jgi:hypothetical protein
MGGIAPSLYSGSNGTGPGLIRKVPPIRPPLMNMITGQLAHGLGHFDHA